MPSVLLLGQDDSIITRIFLQTFLTLLLLRIYAASERRKKTINAETQGRRDEWCNITGCTESTVIV